MYIFMGQTDEERQRKARQRMQDNEYSRYDNASKGIVTMGADQLWREYRNRPICPKCESSMFRKWAKGYPNHKQGYCPRCGYRGSSITIQEYLDTKMYR